MNFGNLHPFFAHFPIALICLIGVLELLRIFIKKIPSFISLIILFISTIMSFLSVQSGEIEKKLTVQNLSVSRGARESIEKAGGKVFDLETKKSPKVSKAEKQEDKSGPEVQKD